MGFERATTITDVRRQMQKNQNQQQSGETFDWKSHAANVRKRYREAAAKVMTDPAIPEQGRFELLAKLGKEYREAHDEAIREVHESVRQFEEQLEKKASPPPRRTTDPGVLMARQELRLQLEGLPPAAIVERFRQGDPMLRDVVADFSDRLLGQNAEPKTRMELGALVAEHRRSKMTPQQLEAQERLEEFRKEKDGVFLGLAHSQRLVYDEARNLANQRPVRTRDDAIGEGRISEPQTEQKARR